MKKFHLILLVGSFFKTIYTTEHIDQILKKCVEINPFFRQNVLDFCKHKINYLNHLDKFRILLKKRDMSCRKYEKLSKRELQSANIIDIKISLLNCNNGKTTREIIRLIDLNLGNNVSELEEITKKLTIFL